MNVRLKELHRAALRDLPRLVQIVLCAPWPCALTRKGALPRTGEQATGDVQCRPGTADSVNSIVQVNAGEFQTRKNTSLRNGPWGPRCLAILEDSS